jgi:anthranilate synthase/aminodeoxychorismate synthase-like glutamine amidotransferase
MIVIIDNYDSFTYNLAQYVGEIGYNYEVFRNDKITPNQIDAMAPSHIIISPGPGRPEDSGISCTVVSELYQKYPILGVCLGHQCIAHAFGATIDNAQKLMHGKISQIYHNGEGIFQGLPIPFQATRYHSLIALENTLPENIHVTAYTSDGEVMGIKLDDYPVEGVQFHPESILTEHGKLLLTNYLNIRRAS